MWALSERNTPPEDGSNYFLKLYIFALNSDFVHKMKCKLLIISLLFWNTYSLLRFQSGSIPVSSGEGQGGSYRPRATQQLELVILLCPENFRQAGMVQHQLLEHMAALFVVWGWKEDWDWLEYKALMKNEMFNSPEEVVLESCSADGFLSKLTGSLKHVPRWGRVTSMFWGWPFKCTME